MTHNSKQKFMFDLNIFDEEEEEEEILVEDLPPPPPTFSEEELAAAKSQSYEEGRAKGSEEQVRSREQSVAQLLQTIAQDSSVLFANEEVREKRYEEEAVQLAMTIFEKLFPLYQKTHGFEELKQTLNQVLKQHNGKATIRVETAPTECDAIEAHLQNFPAGGVQPAQFEVVANESLTEGACKLSWADGGAVRDAQEIAEEIRGILQEILAPSATTRHDGSSDAQFGPASDSEPNRLDGASGVRENVPGDVQPDSNEADENEADNDGDQP